MGVDNKCSGGWAGSVGIWISQTNHHNPENLATSANSLRPTCSKFRVEMPPERFNASYIKNKIKREDVHRQQKRKKGQEKLKRRLALAEAERKDPEARKVRKRLKRDAKTILFANRDFRRRVSHKTSRILWTICESTIHPCLPQDPHILRLPVPRPRIQATVLRHLLLLQRPPFKWMTKTHMIFQWTRSRRTFLLLQQKTANYCRRRY